ncbi:MAG: caspase family protein [Phycisphaerae bacterium]
MRSKAICRPSTLYVTGILLFSACLVFLTSGCYVVYAAKAIRGVQKLQNDKKLEKSKMTLISNQENTFFEMRTAGEKNWRPVGKGKILTVELKDNFSFEVAAKPDGYVRKTHTLAEPVRELRFTFEISDKEITGSPIAGMLPKIKFLKPTYSETKDPTIPVECSIESSLMLKSIEVSLNRQVVGSFTKDSRAIGLSEGDPTGVLVVWREQGATVKGVVPLDLGRNVLEVVTTLSNGQSTKEILMVTRLGQNLSRKPVGQRWGVIIGINEYLYKDKGIPVLRYATKDAQAIYNFLRSPHGGAFQASNIRLLLNKEATTQAVREALFDFLLQAQEDDFVIIYLSCHGSPAPGRPDNLYVITYDTDPTKISSTALPMWDIETALKRQIRADRILVLADTCHSAGVGGIAGTRAGGTNLINKYVQMLSETKPGRAIFTASEANELSFEGEEYGGGHGAFTYFLLEALNGKAEEKKDGIITLGAAMDYTTEKVRRATGGKQHPNTAGNFDRDIPLSVLK